MTMSVEFKLTVPRRGSWDNRWSGGGRNYSLVREIDDACARQLDGRSWNYAWPDGWFAQIDARLIHDASALEPSDGFHGYGWMVDSILQHGKIYADHERPTLTTKGTR